MTHKTVAFAGGCFWCLQPPFNDCPGVVSTRVGFTGGSLENPSYQDVCAGGTGHVEAVEVVFDPDQVSYGELLEIFWRQIDPSDAGGQFADRGPAYKTAIFTAEDSQSAEALRSRDALLASGLFTRIVTEILPLGPFWPADEDHQNYAVKCPVRYGQYKELSGRAPFLRELWGSGDSA